MSYRFSTTCYYSGMAQEDNMYSVSSYPSAASPPPEAERRKRLLPEILSYFFGRVLGRAFANGRSRGSGQMLSLVLFIALTVLNVALGTISINWNAIQWRPIIWTYGPFFVSFLAWHYLRAQWETHKEDAETVSELKGHLREIIEGLPSAEQAGELKLVAVEAYDLKREFLNNSARLQKPFPHPLDGGLVQNLEPTIKGYCDVAVLQRLFELHRKQTNAATSQTSCESPVRKCANPTDKTFEQIFEMLEENGNKLNYQAAALLKPLLDKATISEIDQRC
jgi:hypothetical protein